VNLHGAWEDLMVGSTYHHLAVTVTAPISSRMSRNLSSGIFSFIVVQSSGARGRKADCGRPNWFGTSC
jgi:hypothetical protein